MRHIRPHLTLIASILLCCWSWTAPLLAQDSPEELITRIERAHGHDAWSRASAVRADLTVTFGGQRMIDGSMTFTPVVGQTRLDLKGDVTLVFDGQCAWVSPGYADIDQPRFHLLTWPYFASVPHKLRDGGVSIEMTGDRVVDGKTYQTARMTFAPGTGDSPDDWYILYVEPDTGRLKAMAYIVTYGKGAAATSTPSSIVYDDFRDVSGAIVAHAWSFHTWSEEKNWHGDPIGKAVLSNVQFVTPAPNAFTKPADAEEDPLPRPATTQPATTQPAAE